MKLAGQLAAAALIAVLAFAAPASAKKATLKGQVIGQPYAAKKRTVVPVLLTARSAKRAKLESRLGELRIRSKRVRAPRRKRVATRLLRMNDRVRTRAKVGRRARGVPWWQIRSRKLTVTKRAKTLSAAELQALVDALRGDLARLARTVETLAWYTANGFRILNADLAALRAEFTALRAEFAALAAQVAAAGSRLDALEAALLAQMDAIAGLEDQLQGVLDDVAALNDAVGALGAELTALQGQVATLGSDLAALGATVDGLSSQLGDLSSLGGSVEELLTGVDPGDLADGLADISALQTDLAGLQTVIGGPSSGLVQQVNDLSTVVGGAGTGLVGAVSDLEAADVATEADIAALQGAVDAAEADIAALETLVSGAGGLADDLAALELVIGDSSSGLVQQVNGLQADVDILCGPTSLLDALC